MADKKPEKAKEPTKRVAAKLFDDIKKPEDTLASPTSKPVIVGHTNIIKDPMMSTDTSKSEDEKPKDEASSRPKREIKIQPLSDQEESSEEEKPINTEAEASEPEPKEDESTVVADEDQPLENESPKESEIQEDSTPDPGNSAVVDAIAGTINTKKDRNEAEEKQQLIENEINDLINSKQYNVRIRPTPNKRKARLLVLLLVLIILAGSFWYLGMGPGKDLWLKEQTTKNAVSEPATNTQNQAEEPETKQPLTAFTNTQINTTFSYPNDWKSEVVTDPVNPDFQTIILTSPNEEIDFVVEGSPTVKAEVFLRAKIIVENTENAAQYPSKLTQLTACSSEDLIVGSSNLKLLFTSLTSQLPNISKVNLGSSVCSGEAGVFNASDQVQLSTKKNTYVIFAEYVLSKEYLEKNGIKEEPAVAEAQSIGITTTQTSFKEGEAYKQFIDLLKTLKEL